jgi:hypothetical protein
VWPSTASWGRQFDGWLIGQNAQAQLANGQIAPRFGH